MEKFDNKINDKFIDTLREKLMDAYKRGSADISMDDFFVFSTVNFVMEIYKDIEQCYYERRYVSCAILTRALLDAVMSMVYFLNVPSNDYQNFVKYYMEKGELTKKSKKNDRRMRVTGKDLCENYKTIMKYNVSTVYRKLSQFVHPTKRHLKSIYKTKGNNCFEISILGAETLYSDKDFLELWQIIDSCSRTIEIVLKQRAIS